MLKAILLPLVLLVTVPVAAQQSRTFTYGSGVSSPMGESGLHISASAELASASGGMRRRLELSVHDRVQRDAFLLASLVYPLAPNRAGSPCLLGGAGLYTGGEIPIAANVGAGLESTRLSALPVFVEARLLYAGGFFFDEITSFGIHRDELIPTITAGVRFVPR